MEYEDRAALSQFRLENAESCLFDARTLFRVESYRGATNRAYYAVFNAMRAVLALDGIDRKRHSGVISEFQRLYIKSKIFDSSYSGAISNAFTLRTGGDYEDFYVIGKQEVANLIHDAETFVEAVKEYLASV